MSTIYFQEPPTSGKVVLTTNHGDLDIELWCNEAPRACRNFIQLCLEGYYDETIFHRLVPGFMIQGGDPTGTGTGGESIYGKPFADEYHQRLKFNHRGLVAMANSGPSTNGSQFFINFEPCEWLNKKHTIFGKVVGDTVYNFLSMQNIEVDNKERPINPPKILSTKILINPFDDIIVRYNAKRTEEEIAKKSKLKKDAEQTQKIKKAEAQVVKKKAKNTNLLSFADDEEAQDIVNESAEPNKIISSHDVLNDPRLLKQPIISEEELNKKKREREEEEKKIKELKSNIRKRNDDDDDDDFAAPRNRNDEDDMIKKKRLLAKNGSEMLAAELEKMNDPELKGLKARKNKRTGKTEFYFEQSSESGSGHSKSGSDNGSDSESEEELDPEAKEARDRQKEEYENLRVEILKFKNDRTGSVNHAAIEHRNQEKKLLSALELRRLKYMEGKKVKRHEDEVLDKLNKFKKKLNSADVQKDETNWLNSKLKFHIDSARAYSDFDNKDKLKAFRDEYQQGEQIHKNDFGDSKSSKVDYLTVKDLLKMTDEN